jgi:hypothetical protein
MPTNSIEPHDRAAMELAIATERKVNPRDMAAYEERSSWDEIAAFAVGRCQDRALNLRPWECAPAFTTDDDEPSDDWGHRPQEIALLRRMLRAGVSRFHPDPIKAIAEAEADAKRPA